MIQPVSGLVDFSEGMMSMLLPLGLKGDDSQAQLQDRLQYHPATYEFYLSPADFTTNGWQKLATAIDFVKSSGVQHVVLHQPMKYQGQHVEMATNQQVRPQLYAFLQRSTAMLLDLVQQKGCQVLFHGAYSLTPAEALQQYDSVAEAEDVIWQRLAKIDAAAHDQVMFENSISELFHYGLPASDQKILATNYRLVYDVSHAFIYLHGNNELLQQSLKVLQPQIAHYHLVDSMGLFHDSLPLGVGRIDWRGVLPLLNPQATRIYEIDLADPNNCAEMLASHQYLEKIAEEIK
ncbi:MAG: sugar phosphate isomerase/epimerase [Lactobacillaceae bacterium]|jgi:sugar phosphate isomerase/epimerase|nr:sugar phosphate isomerase/epimerase [Lactobacillaceae bacterium]